MVVEVEGANAVLHDQHLSCVMCQSPRLEEGVLEKQVKSFSTQAKLK